MNRNILISEMASSIAAINRPQVVRVAIDGLMASGKTTIASDTYTETVSHSMSLLVSILLHFEVHKHTQKVIKLNTKFHIASKTFVFVVFFVCFTIATGS